MQFFSVRFIIVTNVYSMPLPFYIDSKISTGKKCRTRSHSIYNQIQNIRENNMKEKRSQKFIMVRLSLRN